ncbi:MAG: hypothetical protein DHS20C12_20670 [Pseudohongiella sp.]|nr:MAG: hypothetical protein DHS20C12_20670 [Pseudohongiella sp.]
MDIKTESVLVDDQAKALAFYTDILGFHKVKDVDLGEYRWLTVSSKGSGETQLLLEPNAHPASKTFQAAIYADGIPATVFHSDNIQQEYKQLLAKGVTFKGEPKEMDGVWVAAFDDSCGNWIQLIQE